MSGASIKKAMAEGRLLGYQLPGKHACWYPTFQFDGTSVVPWVPELIELVGNGFAALHFLTVQRKSLKGRSFLQRIQKNSSQSARGTAVAEMLSAARNLAA